MRIRTVTLRFMAIAALTVSLSETVRADTTASREYRLKAAFLYNFMMFVEGGRFRWKSAVKDPADPNEQIRIGIIGRTPFGDAFEPLKGKTVRDRAVVIKQFKGFSDLADADGHSPQQHPQIAAIRQCHLLFICSSEQSYMAPILNPLQTLGILTVADTPGFLEAGGMMNFLIEENKVRFEVNTAATGRAQLQIRAKLLRLAKRVIVHDAFEKNDQGKQRQPEDE